MKRTSLYSPEHAALVELLRDLRLEAGLSQTAVASALKRPQTYISSIEIAQRGVDMLQVRELAAVYGMTFPVFAQAFEARLKNRTYRPPRRVRGDAGAKAAKARNKGAGRRKA